MTSISEVKDITFSATVTTAPEAPSPIADHPRVTRLWPERNAAVTKVDYLERLLFDGIGQPRRRTSPQRADELLSSINQLRRQLGWLSLDMQHQYCWPEDA